MIKKYNSARSITFLCCVIYFISYLTRLNYGAVVVSISEGTGISQTSLALAPTISFITYGVGQLISGYMGDKFQPRLLVFLGLIATSLMNFLLPLGSTVEYMSVLWGVNGLAQAFMWPPIVKLLLTAMSESEYKKQTHKVLLACIFSTMAIYLLSPLIVSVSGWEMVFYVCAGVGVAGSVYWLLYCPNIQLALKSKDAVVSENSSNKKAKFAPVLIFVLISIVCMGALRDGVTTWVPSYVASAFNLGSETAILSGAVLPVFTIICYYITSYLYRSKLTNPILCAGTVFTLAVVSSGVLVGLTNLDATNVVVSIILAALITGSMHGVNFILISMIPAYFKKQGNISMMSGILNGAVYLGSALSTYLFPLMAKNGGWGVTILIWFIIALVGTAILFIIIPLWNKFESKNFTETIPDIQDELSN